MPAGSGASITPGFPFAINAADLYFGPHPNYANSPLPIGSLGSITVTDGGSGYNAPTVTVSDAYVVPSIVATATATLTGNAITSITLVSPGSGYVAPVVIITDNAGSGASASATLNPATVAGGIRKFVDTLPSFCGLTGGTNGLGQCLPIATVDKTTYPGSDLYQIGLSDYSQKMHTDLPASHLRGYTDLNSAPSHQYLGPFILAQRNRPVRVIFKNLLPVSGTLNGYGTDISKLIIPKDSTYMGAGLGWDGSSMSPYTDNRANLHLHGGNTPWISDGTPHQWITPAGDTTTLKKGVSFQNVPDMIGAGPGKVAGTAGDGSATYYWPNQQSGRLLWFHDHSYGITRLNVYEGEAGGYLLVDPAQETVLRSATVPGTIPADVTGDMDLAHADLKHIVPLVIQDKTFVDANSLSVQDPTWKWGSQPGNAVTGDLWFPHIYMPNQWPDNPDLSGTNPMGRWDYGPWFWPPQNPATFVPEGRPFLCQSAVVPLTNCPGTPNPSGVPEGFMDTPLVNGTAYPVLHVAPEAYRLHILNGSNDRVWNLQMYLAYDPGTNNVGTGTEVKMIPAVPGTYPSGWPTPDARDGGWPDPATLGPNFIEIGTEGGLLPAPAVIPNRPIGFEYGRRSITVLNILEKALLLGPAERADAIVDFKDFAGKTLILYNDAPAPVPAFDSRIDYYTGDPDQTDAGGAPTTLPGYGPNTRTIMQIKVDQTASGATPFSLTALQAALPALFKTTQDPILVPEKAYGFPNNTYSSIFATSLTFTDPGAPSPTGHTMHAKTIQELFTLDYGRMNATLGIELPFTSFTTQTTIPYGYVDIPTEIMQNGENQIWKITHNGVDTHFIHFHLFTVQVLNRVGWDGTIKPPDPNELSWKDTVRMNPLEDVIVAAKSVKQSIPWSIPNSIRPMDVTMPVGTTGQFTNIDPYNNPMTVFNEVVDFGWEYVWHCHLLGHEENDMMRPIIFQVPPETPDNLTATVKTSPKVSALLTWRNNSASETGFVLQRATNAGFTQGLTQFTVNSAAAGATVNYTDAAVGGSPTYYYRVQAINNLAFGGYSAAGLQTTTLASAWSGVVQALFSPVASVSPTSLTFPNQSVNTSSGSQTTILTNTGGSSLTITSIKISGTNPADFTQADACGGTLAVNAKCIITVTFKPAAVGARSAGIVIATNDPKTPSQTVALSGTGVASMQPPTAPSNLTAALSGASNVILKWQDRSNNETGFYLERSANNTTWFRIATVAANSTTYTDGGLNRRTTYSYRAQSFNAGGASAYSGTASVTTK